MTRLLQLPWLLRQNESMSQPNTDFYLIVGKSTESITSKITTMGGVYAVKRLESKPENWESIVELMQSTHLRGVVLTLNESTYARMASGDYQVVSTALLDKLAVVPHIALVHEAVFGGSTTSAPSNNSNGDEEEWDGYTWNDFAAREHFGDIDEHLRIRVNGMLKAAEINPVTYKRNAELSILALAFIDDHQNNLLFRIYIPSGRLYENESAQLLTLFSEWLRTVRGHNVRQGGYQTNHGRVIEFFSENQNDNQEFTADLQQFSEFVASIEDRESSTMILQGLGLSENRAEEIVSRYARLLRRVQVDAKHERQKRILLINQELESELIETDLSIPLEAISTLVNQLVPTEPSLSSGNPILQLRQTPSASIVINNQFINKVKGTVAHHINGDVSYGSQPIELLELISQLGGSEQDGLMSAIGMVSDSNAPTVTRLNAKQKLKTFLINLGGSASSAAIGVGQAWVEKQMGL
ncbi:hypothetical protein [Arthrobacter sp. SDTb3-6]|uniref:hypothetical protein n=1 Tax=Arthrobacter sp. SDTb3-6 TaxID=2713571 RepID=UPI00159D6743|nr:hypothetical protein [Arthrobacter sp. SDTb3-6]NVM98420.1 hypothetical protein [Arthrobacter sp. SDTb3-6]